MSQGAGGACAAGALHPTAGHSWHWVAPCKKNREPRRKKKKKKRQQRRQPAPATLVIPGGAGSREQTVGDSRTGASGKQAPHCAAPAALRAGFVRPPRRHSAAARGGRQRRLEHTPAPAGLSFGDGGTGGRGQQAAAQVSGLCASIDLGGTSLVVRGGDGGGQAPVASCRGHAGGRRERC